MKKATLPATMFLGAIAAVGQTVEYFDESSFTPAAGDHQVITFDELNEGNSGLAGNEYQGCGLTIDDTRDSGINVVRNLVPGGIGNNVVTEANLSSPPFGISASLYTNDATGEADDFDFIFSEPITAAGLFIGNLGSCVENFTTTVHFLDDMGTVIAEEVLHQFHEGVIFGDAEAPSLCGGSVPVPFDNRLFYGIVTDQLIERIRVLNGPNDGDSIVIDDIHFNSLITCILFFDGFESGDTSAWSSTVP